MKRYERYKYSGIEWIGEIPEHWGLSTIGRVFNLGRGRVISSIEIGENPGEYPVYSSQTENNGVMGHLASYDFEGEYVTWTTDGANAGTVFHRKGKFNCTNVCGTIQPKKGEQIDLRYLPYFLNLGTKYSVRLDINPKLMNNMMAKIPFAIPTKAEQNAIANYLDRKTAQIDDLIAKKQRLFEFLNEEKTGIINQAMTKGLNPNAPMKDSGIPWIGKIPAHWEITKLKFMTDNLDKNRIPLSSSERSVKQGEYPYYGATGIIDHIDGYIFDGEYVLIGEDGAPFFEKNRGVAFVASGKFWVNNHAHILRAREGYLPKLIAHQLNHVDYREYISGSTRDKLTQDELNGIRLINIPKEEQATIIDYLDRKTDQMDDVISKTNHEIELLQEYRTALISEAVTGKVKVI